MRLAGHDQFGNKLTPIVDDEGGAPLRCCLRRAAPGEPVHLIAYRPFTRTGPYAETGPVFVHASPCPGYRETDPYPADYRGWPTMVFRPYRHHAGLDCDAIAYDVIQLGGGATAESLIASIFADPTVKFIHTRNVHRCQPRLAKKCHEFETDLGDSRETSGKPQVSQAQHVMRRETLQRCSWCLSFCAWPDGTTLRCGEKIWRACRSASYPARPRRERGPIASPG